MNSTQSPVSTVAAAPRRKLQLDDLGQYLDELDRIASAESAGTLTANGVWTPGKTLGHLAAWIEYGYVGYPMRDLPFFMQWLLRFNLRRTLASGMQPGIRIPGTKEGTLGVDEIPFAEAYANLVAQITRLQKGDEAIHHSPAFGKMTHDERVRLNLRHAELHLSFLSYPKRGAME